MPLAYFPLFLLVKIRQSFCHPLGKKKDDFDLSYLAVRLSIVIEAPSYQAPHASGAWYAWIIYSSKVLPLFLVDRIVLFDFFLLIEGRPFRLSWRRNEECKLNTYVSLSRKNAPPDNLPSRLGFNSIGRSTKLLPHYTWRVAVLHACLLQKKIMDF